MEDVLVVKVKSNGEEKELAMFGDKGFVSVKNQFELGGLYFSLAYGSKYYKTPFYIQLND